MRLKDPFARLSEYNQSNQRSLMNLKECYSRACELLTGESTPSNTLTVTKQGNQIDGVDQYTVHMCYWYAPLCRHYLAAGDLRLCMSEYFRHVSDFDNHRAELKCHHIGFVLGGGE